MLRKFAGIATVLTLSATTLWADDTIAVTDAYARASTPMSVSGAAFMVIENHGATDDRLIAVRSNIADRVELHTHISDANGVMKMVEVEEGFPVAAGQSHALARGGDHVMLLGLKESLTEGKQFPLTLVFEHAGEITVDVPVDLTRMPGSKGAMKMSN